jgi:hypothetical protein
MAGSTNAREAGPKDAGAKDAGAKDAGAPVDCPQCGNTVRQKTMIPILGEDGKGVRYVCVACARQYVDTAPKDVPQTEESSEESSDAEESA